MFDDLINKLTTGDGVRVTADIDSSVYWKLGAVIVVSVLLATIGSLSLKKIIQ